MNESGSEMTLNRNASGLIDSVRMSFTKGRKNIYKMLGVKDMISAIDYQISFKGAIGKALVVAEALIAKKNEYIGELYTGIC